MVVRFSLWQMDFLLLLTVLSGRVEKEKKKSPGFASVVFLQRSVQRYQEDMMGGHCMVMDAHANWLPLMWLGCQTGSSCAPSSLRIVTQQGLIHREDVIDKWRQAFH